ncbi:MAG: beta-aspartyl-peptidase [Clostridiales bacterium]|jgi:beta-aspartyl-dipeptidase (metallo-type)|nr:beta-aspartyl-peptidase [Clostridiales bacterium]
MLTLLKNVKQSPCDRDGGRDVLIGGGKICKIMPPGEMDYTDNIIDCEGLNVYPGLIDQHLHILGGGGEEGFSSRLEEIAIDRIVSAGVTTVVGILGADGCTRGLESLYAKAKALEDLGLTAYLYSGSYLIPAVTLTGSIERDLVFIDKVIGVKTAIADHRSSQPDIRQLLNLASRTHLGGLLGGKAGVLHIHVGDGKDGLRLLGDMLECSDLPLEMFVPTHVNRCKALLEQAVKYCIRGGYIDLTAGEKAGLPVWEALDILKRENIDLSRVTVSSDANGSAPGGKAGEIEALYRDIVETINRSVLDAREAFRLVTENVAKVLKLFPQKGAIAEGADADILIADKNFKIIKLLSKGKLMLDNSAAK